MSAQVSSSTSKCSSKLRGSSQNRPHAASKQGTNITKLNTTEDPPCMWSWWKLNLTSRVKRDPARQGECQLRCCPRHLTVG
ncbi:hypothetical protein AVEN_260469-1 [Araneus ventricosus]|uniref:Uncharacterized protein n=1 Tax=Araneus ventricosus TaxID=182803 RepID=A0A4Y2TR61_ARAVE|nr:hypothetical protein AVEN_260469-1 [Araneus ventricosus]